MAARPEIVIPLKLVREFEENPRFVIGDLPNGTMLLNAKLLKVLANSPALIKELEENKLGVVLTKMP